MANSTLISTTDYQNYKDVPVIRRRWMMIVSFLLFIPLAIYVLLTGKVYAEENGQVKEVSPKSRKMFLYLCIGFLALGLLRFLSSGL